MRHRRDPSPADLDAVDRLLDDLVVAPEAVRLVVPLESDTIRAARRVVAGDDAPPPDPLFIHRLREILMETALPVGRPHPIRNRLRLGYLRWPPVSGPAPRAVVNSPRGGRWASQAWPALEFAAACLLILGFFSAATGLPFNSFVPLTQDDDQNGQTAMYLGNAARTGEMPGPGIAGQPGLLWRTSVGVGQGSPSSSPVIADGLVYLSGLSHDPTSRIESAYLVALDLATGAVVWETPVVGLNDWGTPAVAGGLVFVGTSDSSDPRPMPAATAPGDESGPAGTPIPPTPGDLIAFDAYSGEEIWRYASGRSGYLSPAVAGGLVFIGSADGTLHAIDAQSGEGRWTFAVPSRDGVLSSSSPAVASGTVYIAGNTGRLYAIDAADGQERWSLPIGGESPTTPVINGETVLVGANDIPPPDEFDTSHLDGVGAADDPTPATRGTRAATALPEGGHRIYAVDAVTGGVRWFVDLDGATGPAPTTANGLVFLGGTWVDGRDIVALDAMDGTERWRFTAGDMIGNAPVVAGETVYFGSFDSLVYALDVAGGALRWRIATGGGITTTAFVADGVVVIGSGDGNLYALGAVAPGGGTPAATPIATSDASGLPPCDVLALPEITLVPMDHDFIATPITDPAETPAASVVPVNRVQTYGQVPGIAWDDMPAGEPASPEVVAAIEAVFDQMRACARPGGEERLASFYSEDFYRRPWVQLQLQINGYWTWSPGASGTDLGDPTEVFVLADGRVATIFHYKGFVHGDATVSAGEFGYLVVFVEHDGRWLIDEFAKITPFGQGVG